MRTLQPSVQKGKNLPNVAFVDLIDDQLRHRAKLARHIARRHDLRLNFAYLVLESSGLGGEAVR